MRRLCALLLVLGISASVATRVLSDDQEPDWVKMGKPGEAHKKLEPLVGDFDVLAKFFAPGAAEPTVNKGTMKSRWVLDGRFIQSEYDAEPFGGKFNGIALMGYDNYAKCYTEVWADSSQTVLSYVKGQVDAAGKVFTFTQELTDAQGKKVTQRWVTTIESQDKYVFALSNTGEDGVEHTVFEDTFTRHKK